MKQIRETLAGTMRGVVAQTLLKKKAGGRVAAIELLMSDPAVAHRIRDGQTHQIIHTMQAGKGQGNLLMNESLADLVRRKLVTEEEASDAVLLRALRRLHVGLGHASGPDMVRILRHGGARARAGRGRAAAAALRSARTHPRR